MVSVVSIYWVGNGALSAKEAYDNSVVPYIMGSLFPGAILGLVLSNKSTHDDDILDPAWNIILLTTHVSVITT